jgi:hypothetical protein
VMGAHLYDQLGTVFFLLLLFAFIFFILFVFSQIGRTGLPMYSCTAIALSFLFCY